MNIKTEKRIQDGDRNMTEKRLVELRAGDDSQAGYLEVLAVKVEEGEHKHILTCLGERGFTFEVIEPDMIRARLYALGDLGEDDLMLVMKELEIVGWICKSHSRE
ncbi:MAG: hypothetical protein FJ150_05765 [Euryarchaeota archaeon]|nr:hypothetical protein [Euryarchaeota archaeon]